MATTQQTSESKAYTAFCGDFKLEPEWLGKTFKDENGKSHTITGLNIRSKKFPVVTKQGMSLRAEYVRALMTGTLETYQKECEAESEKEFQQRLQQARRDYLTFGTAYGLKKQWLDTSIADGRHTYTIVGLLYTRTKTVVVARREDGRYKSAPTETIVKQMTGKKAAKAAA